MKIARLISLLLVVIFAVTMFGACGKDSGNNGANGSASGTIMVVKDNESDFIIVKPEKYTQNEWDGAINIFKTYKDKTGATIPNRSDDIERTDNTPEIIIGKTNRPETAKARELLLQNANLYYNEYIVCAVDGNIVIYSVIDENLPKAIDHFINNYLESAEIAGDLVDIHKDDKSYTTINIAGNTVLHEYSIVRSHYETSYLTQLELEELRLALREVTGYDVPIVEDAYVDAGEKEIIIGGSNREGQATITDRDRYEIRVSGSKVYIDGGSDYAISAAVADFTKDVKAVGNLVLNEGLYKKGSYREFIEYSDSSVYELVWSDEFDDTKVDESIWHVCRGNDRSSEAPDGKPVYRSTNDSTFLSDGKLYMLALKDDEAYYGGMIHTFDSLHYQYGYIEIKAKVPDGDGFWAGFWLNGSNWAGGSTVPDRYLFAEFDIMESYGNATGFTPALHRWPTTKGSSSGIPDYAEHTTPTYRGEYADGAARKVWCPDNKLFSDDFHTFGCMWTEDSITITVDGMPRSYLDTTIDPLDVEAFHGYEFIILSLATYFKSCPLTPNATEEEWTTTNMYIVEYIRLFQNDKCDLRWMNK